jgi:pilus assembly protein CpaC
MLVPVMWTSAEAQEEIQAPDMEFTIAVGETLTFSARGVRRVAAGDDSVADPTVTGDGRFLFVTGRSPGVSTINIFSGAGDDQRTLLIRVVGINPTSLAEEVREVLGDGAGVDIRVVKGRVLIEGEVASEIFQRKIDKLTELYPNQVLNFATYREAFVEGARMVAMEVDFIQLATTNRDNIGMQWDQFIGFNLTGGLGDVPLYYSTDDLGPGILPGQEERFAPRPMGLTGGSDLTTYSSLVGNLNFALDFMADYGLLKTLQNTILITEAGTEALYVSGGTILIPVATAQTTDVMERPFGLQLRITPILDFENRVKLTIEMRYEELDFSIGVGNLPGFRGTEVVSTVNMMEGQSVLISAQQNMDNSSQERGFFMLSRIPVLGWAFKSRSLLAEELSNALFITPRVYEPGTDFHNTLVEGVFQQLEEHGLRSTERPALSNAGE